MTDPMTTAAAGPDGAVLEARALFREFRQGPATLPVLTGVELRIGAGERIAIVGSSGSGKTTLLQILGGLDRPTSGCVEIAGRDIHALDETARGALRNRTIGFVYQFHHLLPEFTALENVAMPLLVRRMPTREARAAAAAILVRVGLGERLDHKPQVVGRRAPARRGRARARDGARHRPGRRTHGQPRRTERRADLRAAARTESGARHQPRDRHP